MIMLRLCLLAALCLVACKKQGAPEGTIRPAAGGKKYGGIFRVNENGELSSLDPVRINDVTSAHIAENIYDNLLSFDEHLQLRPEIAKSWVISDDGRTYTYFLRSDVWFHDDACFPNGKGRRLVASDVVYSLSRICDARTGTKAFDYFRGKVEGANAYFDATTAAMSTSAAPSIAGVSGIRAVNDSVVSITLVRPFAPFENAVALTAMAIVPREAVERYGRRFAQHPVGTGPFRFREWVPDRFLLVDRNERYWKFDEAGNRLPLLDGVRFSFMKDDKMQLLEFKDGNLEESYRIPNEFFTDIVDENKRGKGPFASFPLLHVPATASQYYGMLTIDPIMKDRRVRQALSYAVDRSRIIKYVLRGQAAGPAIHGLVPPSMPGYPTDSVRGYSFDPDKARALLAAAGYPNGKGLPEITLQLNAGGGRNVQIAEAIQGMIEDVLNIRIRLKQVEFAQHLEAIDAGRAPFYRLGWVADYPDPETFLNLWYGKLVPSPDKISPLNSVRYTNPAFDAVFEQALATTDRAERMKLYARAENIAMADAPMLMIFYDEDYRFIQPYVRDYRNNAMDRRMYKYVWFDR
jgi:peptide/nickel transport system substrate-binding protein